MAQSKATKKFEKNHLKDVLKRRKDFAKIKQKKQLKEKKRSRRVEEQQNGDDDGGDAAAQRNGSAKGADSAFANMSVDEFFQGGFDIPDRPVQRKGKRKRTVDEPAEESDGSAQSESEDEIAGHKQQLEALAKNDPEFYKHLQEEEPELLDFGDDTLGNIVLSESEDDAELRKKKSKTAKGKQVDGDDEAPFAEDTSNEVTKSIVKKWHESMTSKKSLRQMREAILAFRVAVRSNDEEGKEYKYSVSDPDVYHELLITTMTDVPTVLSHHLPVKETAAGKLRVSNENAKFRSLNPILKTYAASLQHLLSSLSDAATLKLTLSAVLPILPYVLSFKKLIRELCRSVAKVWSSSAHSDATRIAAFLLLRRLTVIGDPGIRENVLKAAYQGLVQGSKTTTLRTLAGINLMKNSAVELWALVDPSQAYTIAFNSIRQLAIHLRNSIINKSKEKEAHKQVYNWQFIHSLDFWSRLLSTHCSTSAAAATGKTSALQPLIYPLVQVAIATLRLLPTPAYYPLRFHVLRLLIRVARATETYVPLAPSLLEVLSSPECKRKPKPASLKPVEWDVTIRVPKPYLRTRLWQDGLGEQVTELLGEWAGQWAKSIAFPELVLPVCVMLKRWLRDASGKRQQQRPGAAKGSRGGQGGKAAAAAADGNHNPKLNSAVSLLVQKFEANSRFIEAQRAHVDFAPNDRAGVEAFLKETEWEKTPLGAYLAAQRKVREEKRKVLETGRRADEEKRASEKRDASEDDAGMNGFEEDVMDEDEDEDDDIEEDED